MATLYTQQDKNIRKTWFLMGGFLLMVIGVGYGVSYYFNDPIILYFAVAFALLTNFGSYWYSDKLVLSMTGAKPVTLQEVPELYRIVENLSITAGLPMPKVYIIEDPSPNAFATGRDPEHAAVAATTGLLKLLDKNELEGVMAHEMSHIGNRDMLVMTVAVVLAGFVTIMADFFSRGLMYGGRDKDRGLVHFLVAILILILSYIAAQLLKTAVSRKREYLADASAALLTRYPEGLASALEKISGAHQPMQRASHATAHLFINDPFSDSRTRSLGQRINGLFATHPPAEDRIRILREMGN